MSLASLSQRRRLLVVVIVSLLLSSSASCRRQRRLVVIAVFSPVAAVFLLAAASAGFDDSSLLSLSAFRRPRLRCIEVVFGGILPLGCFHWIRCFVNVIVVGVWLLSLASPYCRRSLFVAVVVGFSLSLSVSHRHLCIVVGGGRVPPSG